MKTYQFAPISAREFPTLHLLDNPYIWGGVGFALNVSEKPYPPEIESAMKEGGACLNDAYATGRKMIVHCDFRNNRSMTE